LELYLKTLAILEHADQSHLQDHDSRNLLADLHDDTRKMLRERWEQWVAANPGWVASLMKVAESFPEFAHGVDCDQLIEQNAKAFEEWRYSHEFVGKRALPWTAQPFVSIVRGLIVERKPEWASHVDHFRSGVFRFIVR